MPRPITALKLRHHLGEVLDQVANRRASFIIKRAGIPAAILLSIADYEDVQDMLDTVAEQKDPVFRQSLVAARKEIQAGGVAKVDDLRRDLEVKERRSKRRR